MRPLFIGLTLIGLTGLLQGCGSDSPTGPQVLTQCQDPKGDINVSCNKPPVVVPPVVVSPAPAAEIPNHAMGAILNDGALGAIP